VGSKGQVDHCLGFSHARSLLLEEVILVPRMLCHLGLLPELKLNQLESTETEVIEVLFNDCFHPGFKRLGVGAPPQALLCFWQCCEE